jgi:hypothetical protein
MDEQLMPIIERMAAADAGWGRPYLQLPSTGTSSTTR